MKHTFKTLLLSAGLALASAAPVYADAKTEAYVLENSNAALKSLSDADLTFDVQVKTFNELMDEFTDLERISNFAIGKYARRFSDTDLANYHEAYRRYALANYLAELDKFRGGKVELKGSVDTKDGRYSVVETIVKRPSGDLPVKWRVMKLSENGKDSYQVVDVGLNVDGNELWLAIEQRAQFLALLDRSNGDAKSLIIKMNELTAEMKREANAGTATTGNGPITGNASNAGIDSHQAG